MDESQDPETIEFFSHFVHWRRSRKTSTGFIRRKAPTDNTVGAFQIALTKVNRSRHTDNSVSRLSTKWETR